MKTISKERKKQLSDDLLIILLSSVVAPAFFVIFNKEIKQFTENQSIHIVLRTLIMGLIQFGAAGLGASIVCIFRKESFLKFGLTKKNLIPALLLSLACCLPEFIYRLCTGKVERWLPFQGVKLTSEVISSGIPWNILSMLIIGLCWGFFEGFNYVIIRDKLSELLPSKYKYLDWGALICAVMCILIHGAVGATPDAIIEMLTVIFLIYGMLLVRKLTGNAWGCVLIFFVYWNAV